MVSNTAAHTNRGQALAEFALIIVVVLMLLFLILEAGRVLWAWVTVQSAARDGARYAITGQDDCAPGLDRLECVITVTHKALNTLPLNEDPDRLFEDDEYYLIEIYGADENGQLLNDYAGAPGQPVIVRVTYRVPIITPLLRPIRTSLPVFGQVVMNNEQYTNMGGATAGVGLPPPVPPLPTPGVTPSPTSTPTVGPSPTATATSSPTASPTATPCGVHFEGPLVQGQGYADVSGAGEAIPGADIIIYDTSVTTTPGVPRVVSTATLGDFDGHGCPGYVRATVNPPLEGGHVMLVRNLNPGDDSSDTSIVLTGTPTPSPSPTFTPSPTSAPTNTPTPTSSPTPVGPYIVVNPQCGFAPTAQLTIRGVNWPSNNTVNLFWVSEDKPPAYQGPANGPLFQQAWTIYGAEDGEHYVEARSGNIVRRADFTIPCPNVTPTPGVTPTPTFSPADLVISGPELISTPPIVEYEPLEFRYVITNTGSTDVEAQFFTDAYLDPPASAIFTDTIDLAYSGGYQALSSLTAGASQVLTITAPLGFGGGIEGTRTVYGMVDSLEQIDEPIETNNLTDPLHVPDVTPAASPTPSPTPGGSDSIGGVALAYISTWAPQRRAQVWLVNSSNGTVVAGPVQTAANGRFTFNGVTPGTYDLYACITIDNRPYVGVRPGALLGDAFADIFLQLDPLGCPY